MRFAVLGAGLQGSAAVFDLLRQDGVERVLLLDRVPDRLPGVLEGNDDPRLEIRAIDFEDPELVDVLSGYDVALGAAPFYLNYRLSVTALEAGVHYCDLGGNTEIVFRQKELDKDARARGVSVIPDVGLAPGMVNVIAAHGISQLEETEAVRIYVGGLPQNPEPPLNYAVVYSLEGALDYYTTPSWVLRDGKRVQVEALSEVELLEFPELGGQLEAFHTGGGISTLPWKYENQVRTMEYKTLRYKGHAHIMRAIRDVGLLDLEPVEIAGYQVVPRDVFIGVVGPKLSYPQSRDIVVFRAIVEGRRNGSRRRLIWELIDRCDPETGISAMERATGFSLSITGMMQARGQVCRPGVATPDEAIPAHIYIDELAKRGIEIQFREE